MPPNLRNIDVALTCEMLNATTKQTEKFSASNNFTIITNETVSDKVMSMPYLKKVNGSYQITFLGRNGEPAAKKKVNLQISHRLKRKNPMTATLITNKQG